MKISDVRTPEDIRVFHDLISRLPYEPTALSTINIGEDENSFGWNSQTRALASVVEELRAVQQLIVAMVSGKNFKPKIEPYEGSPQHRLDALQGCHRVTDFSEIANFGVPTEFI